MRFALIISIFLSSLLYNQSYGQEKKYDIDDARMFFLVKFIYATEWKETPNKKEFNIGIADAPNLMKKLQEYENRGDLKFQIRELKSIDEILEFDVIYIPSSTSWNAQDVSKKLHYRPILFFGEGYSQEETMVHFIPGTTSISFEVNQYMIQSHRMKIDIGLYNMSINKQEGDLKRLGMEAAYDLRSQEKRNLKLESQLDNLKEIQRSLSKKIRQEEFKLYDLNEEVEASHQLIEESQAQIAKLEKAKSRNENELVEIKNEIEASHNQFDSLNKVYDQKEAEIRTKNQELELATEGLAMSRKEMLKMLSILENQKMVIYGSIFILLIISALGYFAFSNYKKQKRQTAIIEKNRNEIQEQHLELTEKNREITDSIAYAKRIQSAIMPPIKLIKEYLHDSFILYEPKDVVAGDFYWMLPENEEGLTIFAAADCTGHGVPGAMVSVVCNSALNRAVKEFGLQKPGDILTKTRELVIEEFEKSDEEVKDGMDIALCSLQGNQLLFAGANNPLWIIRKGSKEVEIVTAHKQAIGLMEDTTPFPTHEIKLNRGDSFYLFSDGFADQFGGEHGKKFKAPNFRKLLLSIQDQAMEQQLSSLSKHFHNWKGPLEQVDDVCVIGVRI